MRWECVFTPDLTFGNEIILGEWDELERDLLSVNINLNNVRYVSDILLIAHSNGKKITMRQVGREK